MSLLLQCQGLTKSFGSKTLFEDLSFSIFLNNRIGLIGPNGAGKSTFLKVLVSLEKADSGVVSIKRDTKIGYVPQTNEYADVSVFDILFEEIKDISELPDYEKELKVEIWLSKFGFQDKNASAKNLSGGWKKRLAIAQALIHDPDVLLLDEPTNHLDLEGIVWLEKFLRREVSTYVIISHDRYFLENLTNRMVEINPLYPRGIFNVEGSYLQFLEKKELFIEGQLEQERSIAGKMRRETDWLRQSPKARTTKSQARIDAAEEIFKEHDSLKRRNTEKKSAISFTASERETRQLLIIKNLCMNLGNKVLFQQLNLTISPGTRLGLMGPNGSGKTTFLKLIAGELEPTQGTIKQADDLKIVYFDQHRNQLSLDTSLREALAPNGDYVYYQGRPIHVNGWCKRFLFSEDYLDLPLKKLSGGERARIAIARLMLQPADILLLDEPTNDLDIPTLETLEETLQDFPGAVILITHDRCMLDNLCNTFLALGSQDKVEVYADYAQWEKNQFTTKEVDIKAKKVEKEEGDLKIRKLSYKEKKECEQLEKEIPVKEKELHLLKESLNDTQIAKDEKKLLAICKQIADLEESILKMYDRWGELQV